MVHYWLSQCANFSIQYRVSHTWYIYIYIYIIWTIIIAQTKEDHFFEFLHRTMLMWSCDVDCHTHIITIILTCIASTTDSTGITPDALPLTKNVTCSPSAVPSMSMMMISSADTDVVGSLDMKQTDMGIKSRNHNNILVYSTLFHVRFDWLYYLIWYPVITCINYYCYYLY